MRKLAVLALVALTGLTGAEAAMAQTRDTQVVTGVWRNPKNTVHVRIQPCGANLCGTVAWASAQAIEEARQAGTPNLMSVQLFRQFRRESEGYFGGTVFVPDMNRSFSGTMQIQNQNAITVRGCLLGRILCRSQTWVRVG